MIYYILVSYQSVIRNLNLNYCDRYLYINCILYINFVSYINRETYLIYILYIGYFFLLYNSIH